MKKSPMAAKLRWVREIQANQAGGYRGLGAVQGTGLTDVLKRASKIPGMGRKAVAFRIAWRSPEMLVLVFYQAKRSRRNKSS